MKKLSFLLLIPCMFFTSSCDPKTLDTILNSGSAILTDADMSSGLKEALNLGVKESVSFLSAKDGYYKSIYKVFLPEEAQTIVSKLNVIPGFSNLEEEALKRINQAAEDAASKAGPIFLSAITSMSFSDVKTILLGEKNAATQYLVAKTRRALYEEFKPVMVSSLNKFGALDYWGKAVNKYNMIPFVTRMNPDLADHVSDKALDGLFALVEKKEYGIRTDISQRTSDLLKKVFSKQD